MASYDDRDGLIWMDGKMIDWRDANAVPRRAYTGLFLLSGQGILY